MALAVWLGGYLLALFLEVAVLPRLLGAAVPAVSQALLLIGIAEQPRSPGAGLALAAFAGLTRDLLAPPGMEIHTLVNCFTFLAMHLAMGLGPWDEPIRRIVAALAGLAAIPLSRLFVAAVGGAAFGLVIPAPSLSDLGSSVGRAELFFAVAWVLAYTGIGVIRFRRARQAALLRLR